MINAVPTTPNKPIDPTQPDTLSGSLMGAPGVVASAPETVIPPKVLPSQLSTHANRPATTPHTNVDGLSESLASKINVGDSATQTLSTVGSGIVTPPPTLPGSSSEPAQLPSDGGKPFKKGFPLKNVIAALVFALVLVGAGATYYLTQTSQDLRQRASTGDVYPTNTPASTPTAPPTGSNCQQGIFNCSGRAPADCSSNAGQGCYYSGTENTCKCGSGGSGQPPQGGGTCNASSGKATVCAGSTALNICVLECQQSGSPGSSCNYGCNGSCTNRTVAANTCQTYGNTLSCGKWQVDVHGDVSCSDSGCSSSGCGGGGTPGTVSANIGVSQSNCVNVPGKYQTGSPITFNASGTNTTRTEIIIAKVTAAGNALDATFNANCPVGSAVGNTGHFCKITEATSTTWTPTVAGKYAIIVNGYSATSNCSGNPFCPYNAGSNNPITPTQCAGAFISCSESDFQIFEVVPAAQCTTPTAPAISATVGISQANCVNVPGKYQTGSAISFTAAGTNTSRTEIIIAKLTAAGNALDATFNANCPIGAAAGNTGHFCKITEATTASWAPTQPGKYAVMVNGYATGQSCSGNPFCPYNAGADNPITPTQCSGGWVSCSNTDFKIFEVVAANSCTTQPQPTAGPMCLNITAQKTSGEALAANAQLQIGDQIKFSCGNVAGVTTYGFRVKYTDGTVETVPAAGGSTSNTFTVSKATPFSAQCTICPNGQCYPFDAGN